jgi:hypothetical protein
MENINVIDRIRFLIRVSLLLTATCNFISKWAGHVQSQKTAKNSSIQLILFGSQAEYVGYYTFCITYQYNIVRFILIFTFGNNIGFIDCKYVLISLCENTSAYNLPNLCL